MVITQDPDSDWVNAGTYRVSVRDNKTLQHLHRARQARRHSSARNGGRAEKHCPMVVSVGQAPALGAAAAATSPENVCEFDVAGGRIGRPINLVKGRVTGVPFPTDCELVYEGFMPLAGEAVHERGPVRRVAGLLRGDRPGAGAAGEGDLSPQRSDPVRDAAGAADAIPAPISAPPARR